jgi:Ca-activated chloride channel homolog
MVEISTKNPILMATAAACVVVVIAVIAELVHLFRVSRVSRLAFGPKRSLYALAFFTPILRVVCLGMITWGIVALFFLEPKSHKANVINESDYRHLVLVLDVSPSMYIQDAGPGGKQTRAARAADIIQSFFERVAAERYKTTVIAFYTDAKPVVKDTLDREVVRNILTELPMRHAFKSGQTNIFAGLEMAAEIAKPWPPGSAVVMLVTDGDTVPATGMPKMPPSVSGNVVVIGLGNPTVGKMVGGHLSRQDVSTLRQVATRLNGNYHDGNDKMLSTELVSRVDEKATQSKKEEISARDLALLFLATAGPIFALLPFVLSIVGTGWTPGRRTMKKISNKSVENTAKVMA